MRRGWGTALLAGVIGWGVAALVALGLVGLGLGRRRPRRSTSLAIGDPGHDGGRGHARPARPARLAGHRRAGRPRRRAATAARRPRRDRRAPPLPRAACGSPGGRASGRSCRRRAGGRTVDATGRAAAARARGGRRRLRQARPDRRDTRSTCCRPRSATSSPSCRTGSPPEPVETIAARARGRARRRRRRRVRRVRLGAARGGVDRPDLPRPPALRRGRRRQGPATRHRATDRARPRRARAARRTSRSGARRSARACAPARCSAQFAQSLRAELDFRREADAMAEMALLARPSTSTVRVPKVYRELCTRRLLVQERFEGFTVADSRAARRVGDRPRRRSPSSCCARRSTRCCAIGFFHADPHPGQRVRVRATARSGSSTSAPSAGSTRSSRRRSSTCCVGARPARRRACCATASSGSPTSPRRRRPSSSSGRWPGSMAEQRAADRHRRADRAAGPRRACSREFGIRLPADLVVLSRALVTLDGTLRVISPRACRWCGRDRA